MPGKFVLKKARNGKFRWNLVASNGQVILTSQMYATKPSAKNGIAAVKKNCADDSKFERKTSKKGDPYFVMKSGNGQVIGNSEQYKKKASMENGIKSVGRHAPDAPTVED